jgi:hypothetical protein
VLGAKVRRCQSVERRAIMEGPLRLHRDAVQACSHCGEVPKWS